MNGGVFIYVGVTQSGKTTKALEDARADIRVDGRPCLVLDLGPARNFRGTYHEPDRAHVLGKLYGARTHCVYTPSSPEDFDALLKGVAKVGDVHVIVDEVRWVASYKNISLEFTQALRHWAHGEDGPTTWRCTSQRPSDLHRDFYACLTGELYAFRTAPGPDLDRLVRECGFDPDVLAGLDRGSFLTFSGKWEEEPEEERSGNFPEQGPGEKGENPPPEPASKANPVDSEPVPP